MKLSLPLLLLGVVLYLCFAEEEIECGTKGEGIGRIVGGTDVTTVGQWPWQIALFKRSGHFCGGSIIKPNWIVTAAHCFKPGAKPSKYRVTVADLNLAKNEGSEKVMEIEKIIRHTEFNKTGYMENDIAVLKLKTNITFNDKVRPICLPTKRFPDGENCYATGWGWINAFKNGDQPVRSPILKQLKVPLVSDQECEKLFRRLPPGVICGGYKVEPKGICKGDSGGPLACKNESGIWNLAGTVSFSLDGCAQKDTYDYFTDIANYKGWVEDQINKN